MNSLCFPLFCFGVFFGFLCLFKMSSWYLFLSLNQFQSSSFWCLPFSSIPHTTHPHPLHFIPIWPPTRSSHKTTFLPTSLRPDKEGPLGLGSISYQPHDCLTLPITTAFFCILVLSVAYKQAQISPVLLYN